MASIETALEIAVIVGLLLVAAGLVAMKMKK